MFSFLRHFSYLLIIVILLGCSKKPTDGTNPYQPVYPVICDAPAWSPDGNTIAYVYNGIIEVHPWGGATVDPSLGGIWFMNPDGTNKRMFLHGGAWPDWSPDGQKLVIGGSAQIYTIKTNGDSLTQLTFSGRNFFPDWAPDGKRIAYSTSAPVDSSGIWIINVSHEYSKHLGLGYMPDWSPDGSRLVYIGLGNNLYVADTNGNNRIQLTFLKDCDNRHPVFSPDGKKIAFSSASPYSGVQIYVMNSDGSDLKKLTTEGGTSPCWSPDGTKIPFVRRNWEYSSKQGQIWIMDADGNNKTQLTFEGW